MRKRMLVLMGLVVAVSTVWGQGRGGERPAPKAPPLFLREEWKQTPAGGEHPVVPAESVANPAVEMRLYGPGSKDIQLTGGGQ